MKPTSTAAVALNGVEYAHQDIEKVVNDFYTQVAQDDLLKIPFQSVHDWPHHIARMTHFWWGRFGGESYMNAQYNPPLKHYHAGFNAEYLERWLSLFHSTLSQDLRPEQAEVWGLIAVRMGQGLLMKNEMMIAHFAGHSR